MRSGAPLRNSLAEIDGVSIYRQERRRAEEALLKVAVVLAVFGGERVNLSERYDYPSKHSPQRFDHLRQVKFHRPN